MKTFWKWLLGITIVLILVAVIVVPFIMHSYMSFYGFGGPAALGNGQNGWQHPSVPGFNGDFDGRNFRHGGMHGGFGEFGMMPFGFMFLGGILRLLPLVLLGLLVFGVYQLGKKAGSRSVTASASHANVVAPQAEPAPENPESATPAE